MGQGKTETSHHGLDASLNKGRSTRGIDRNLIRSTPPRRLQDKFFVRMHGGTLHRDPLAYGSQSSRGLFGNSAPLHVDIGTGGGDYVIDRAVNEPGRNFVGIEVHTPSIFDGMNRNADTLTQLADEIDDGRPNNLRLIHADVSLWLPGVPDGALDTASVRFPPPITFEHDDTADLLSPRRLWGLIKALRENGGIEIASDSRAYVAAKKQMLERSGAFVCGPERRERGNPRSRYERKAQEGLSGSSTTVIECTRQSRGAIQGDPFERLQALDPKLGKRYYRDR